ncbi:MAG: MAPEG family protein [Dongiaceae bacterium]
MTVDLHYLTWSSLLCLLLWVPYVIARFGIWGVSDTVGYPTEPKPLPEWATRSQRAHLNMVENLVPFAALVLTAHMAGLDNEQTAAGSAIFFWSRLAHALVYMLAIPWLRTILFIASWVGSLMVFLAIVGV